MRLETSSLPYEYGPKPRMLVTRVLVRSIRLTSDAIVLLLASPFFVVWYSYRVGRNYVLGARPTPAKIIPRRSKP